MRSKYFMSIFVLIGTLALGSFAFAQGGDLKAQTEQADRLWNEKSYRMAVVQYEPLLAQPDLSDKTRRELTFKWADSAWRTKEQRRYEQAVKSLDELVESKEHDRWRAEAGESLAEPFMEIDRWSHTEEIKKYLQIAREFWASSKDIDLARERFIKASFTLGDFIQSNWGWSYTGIEPVGI